MAEKFFSDGWCATALAAESAASTEIMKRLKKPSEFTHVLALEVSDRPGLETQLRYEQGRCVAWGPKLCAEDEVWARFSASLENWHKAGTGQAKASNLVMAGKMKLTKGAMKDAVENAAPFDRLVQCFTVVDTDWDV
jgi:putative sterol carrier protein